MKITEQYSVNDGEYIDNSVYECIQYMIEDDIPKEHIVGYKLVVLELEKCIDDKTMMLMRNTLYDRCEDRFDDGDWLDNKLDKIWSQFEDLEMFYDSGKYYTITEEDYEEVIKVCKMQELKQYMEQSFEEKRVGVLSHIESYLKHKYLNISVTYKANEFVISGDEVEVDECKKEIDEMLKFTTALKMSKKDKNILLKQLLQH